MRDYVRKQWNNVFTSLQNLDSYKKSKGGESGGCSPPQNVEYCTQGVYAGQHTYCDHMEHRLRQNRDSNGKRGEAQTR